MDRQRLLYIYCVSEWASFVSRHSRQFKIRSEFRHCMAPFHFLTLSQRCSHFLLLASFSHYYTLATQTQTVIPPERTNKKKD